MRKIELKELQEIELNLLKKFRDICEKEGFTYALCGGTLLGAVRHKGFIPWDDDIDVFMPRPDYQAFLEYCKDNNLEDFGVASKEIVENYNYLYSKIFDKRTVVFENVTDEYSEYRGVYIDIFPIDGLGNTLREAIKQYRKSTFQREILVASFWNKFFRSKTRPLYIEPIRFTFYVLGKITNQKKLSDRIERMYSQNIFDDMSFSGCVCGAYREREIMPKSVFSNLTDLEFEGDIFKAPRDYDFYLTQFYGDYMQLPPEEKRRTHHMFEAYWKK